MIKLTKIVGFLNRHIDKLPTEKTVIKILVYDIGVESVFVCEWNPSLKNNDGYLGTAKVIEGEFKGIGFHAWEQKDNEFIWYNILNKQ